MVAGLVMPHMCLASARMPHGLVTSGRMASTCASACPPLLRSLALTLTHESVRSDDSSEITMWWAMYRICKEGERERELYMLLYTHTLARAALYTHCALLLRVLVQYYCFIALLLYCRWWRGACSRACRRLSATRSRPKKQKKRWARGA